MDEEKRCNQLQMFTAVILTPNKVLSLSRDKIRTQEPYLDPVQWKRAEIRGQPMMDF